ncbi:MAG: hypothetical protein ABW110_01780 [Steroidobacteraceae bacterium]
MNLRAMMLIACWIGSAAALAQEPAPAASDSKAPAATKTPTPSTPARSDPAKKDEAANKEAKDADAKKAATKPTKDSAGTPQRFIPTEQVRSDFDVSFPVDI